MNQVRFAIAILAVAALALASAACGSSGSEREPEAAQSPASGEPQLIAVQALRVKFQPDAIRVKLDVPFELRLENLDAFEHDLQAPVLPVDVVEGGSDRPEHAASDEDGEVRMLALHTAANETMSGIFVARERGTFDIWCTLPGHKEQGMIGTIIVE